MQSRRNFLATTIAVGVPAGILALVSSAQVRGQRPQNPQQPKDDDSNASKFDPKLVLEANQKEIKKSVERLYDLASELKAEVEKRIPSMCSRLPCCERRMKSKNWRRKSGPGRRDEQACPLTMRASVGESYR